MDQGLAGSWLLRWSARRRWVRGHWQPVHTVALSIACFASAQAAGGSGFIAAFVGGLLFGALVTRHKDSLLRAAESTGEVFALAKDSKTSNGFWGSNNSVSNMADVRNMFNSWALQIRTGLEHVTGKE